MGLEAINNNSRPGALNPDWPVGTTDATLFGAIHIRNIKVVLKNFQLDLESYRTNFDNKLEEVNSVMQFKAAINTKLVDGANAALYLEVASRIGQFVPAKLPLATTSAKGIVQLSNAIDSDSEGVGATPKALWLVSQISGGSVSDSDTVRWRSMSQDPGVPDKWWHLPAAAKGWLSQGFDVEVRVLMEGTVNMGGSAVRLTFNFVIFADEYVLPRSDRSDRSSTIWDNKGFYADSGTYADDIFHPTAFHQERKSTSTESDNTYERLVANGQGLYSAIVNAKYRKIVRR